jgi:FdhE protein
LLKLVAAEGSDELRVAAAAERDRDWATLLSAYWGHSLATTDEHTEFFLSVLMQPFAEYVASRAERGIETAMDACPVCASAPQLGVMRPEGEGAKRWLMCSLCAAEWQYRRVVCPRCGQEDKEKLPVFKSEKFPHIQIAACEVCNIYLKCIDLSIDGHAVPQVDDLASLPMSLWAQRQGYAPIHPNILGF